MMSYLQNFNYKLTGKKGYSIRAELLWKGRVKEKLGNYTIIQNWSFTKWVLTLLSNDEFKQYNRI